MNAHTQHAPKRTRRHPITAYLIDADGAVRSEIHIWAADAQADVDRMNATAGPATDWRLLWTLNKPEKP